MQCVSENELVELLEDRLSPERRDAIIAELDRCSECRAIAREWAQTSTDRGGTDHAVHAPESVGDYRLERLIGVGAMGLVFRARDATLDRDVAVKVVRASDESERARALEEGRLLANVRHPNVIAVHAAGIGDGIVYFVMELVDGRSLDTAIADGAIEWRTASRWFAGVASGLAQVHAAGVIHRDIKPSNLLLDRDTLRVADFGLASRSAVSRAGTPAYFAPEVAAGGTASTASDQYSFFVTLYEAVAGRRPFAASDLDGHAWPNMPARLKRIVERGLARDPAKRWPDMASVERELRGLAARRRWPWVGGAMAGTVAVAAFAIARPGASACEVGDPGWALRADSRIRAGIAEYETQWREVGNRICDDDRATASRACLSKLGERVEALLVLAVTSPTPNAMQAVADLPAPGRCLVTPDLLGGSDRETWRTAQALFALGRDREARAALPPPDRDGPELALLRGQIAHRMTDLREAETALQHAVTLAGRADQASVLVDAQLELAIVVGFVQDRHDAGAVYAETARAIAERKGDQQRAALALSAQGLIAASRGDHAHAVEMLTSAIDELTRSGAPQLVIATAHKRLGWVLRESDRITEARPHVERARALTAGVLGDDHPGVALLEIELGMIEAREGKYPAALARYRVILARPTTSETVASAALSAAGAAELRTGDYDGARTSFTRALALRRKLYGDRNTDVARAHLNLASTYYYQGKFDAAIESYRAADSIMRSLLGGKHPEVATARSGLALALQAANRLPEAGTTIAEVIAIYRDLPGHDASLADALMTSGTIEFAGDRLPAARAALEESFAIQNRLYGAESGELATILSLLGELYLSLDQLAEAERVLLKARELRKTHGLAPQLIAENDFVLAMVVWKRGDHARAREHAQAARRGLGDARPDLKQQIDDWLRTHR